MGTKVDAQPMAESKGWTIPVWVPYLGSSVKLEEAPIPEKKSLWGRFTEFSDMQKQFIAEQPLVAAVYMVAAVFFGLPHLLSFNPFSCIYGALTVYFGFALAWNTWNNEGIMTFASRVIAEFKAYTSGTEEKKDDKEAGSTTAFSAA